MTRADDVLDLARLQLGTAETPPGSNIIHPYGDWFGQQGIQWCAVFVSWVFHQIDPALVHGLKSYYSGDFLTVGRKYGEEVAISEALPGDIVVFDYGDGGITDHIGIIESRRGPTSFFCIEGNHNNRVERVTRIASTTCRMWFIHPAYEDAPTAREENVLYQFLDTDKMDFENVWPERNDYYLITRGKGAVRLTLIPEKTGKPVKRDPYNVNGVDVRNLKDVAAWPASPVKGSYAIVGECDNKINWALREVPK